MNTGLTADQADTNFVMMNIKVIDAAVTIYGMIFYGEQHHQVGYTSNVLQ